MPTRFLLAAVASLVFAAPPAAALTLVPDPLPLLPTVPIPGFAGTADVVTVTAGIPAGGTVQAGSVAPGDLTIVLEISLDASAPEVALTFGVYHPSGTALWTGAGTIPGSATSVVGAINSEGAAFVFAPNLAPGEAANWLFVSIPALAAGEDFDVALFGFPSGEQPIASGSFTAVPEPSATALLALGLATLARRRGRGCSGIEARSVWSPMGPGRARIDLASAHTDAISIATPVRCAK